MLSCGDTLEYVQGEAMTTPTFRDWTVIFGKCIQGHGPREFERSKPLARYILSRIERKEKALHDRADRIMEAVAILPLKLQAERSRIAERVRGAGQQIGGQSGALIQRLADDIKEGKV